MSHRQGLGHTAAGGRDPSPNSSAGPSCGRRAPPPEAPPPAAGGPRPGASSCWTPSPRPRPGAPQPDPRPAPSAQRTPAGPRRWGREGLQSWSSGPAPPPATTVRHNRRCEMLLREQYWGTPPDPGPRGGKTRERGSLPWLNPRALTPQRRRRRAGARGPSGLRGI